MTRNQYTCSECGKALNSQAELEQHNRSMHSRFTCEACGELFRSPDALETHNRELHPNRQPTPQR